MPKGYKRTERISDLLQVALAEILRRNASDLQIGMVTITGVDVAHDLSYAKVYVSILEDDKVDQTMTSLKKATKSLRYELAQAVKLRATPELRFIYDDSTSRGHRISTLINDALKK